MGIPPCNFRTTDRDDYTHPICCTVAQIVAVSTICILLIRKQRAFGNSKSNDGNELVQGIFVVLMLPLLL